MTVGMSLCLARRLRQPGGDEGTTKPENGGRLQRDSQAALDDWENYARNSTSGFIVGDRFTVADSAFYPLLHELMMCWKAFDGIRYPALRRYRDWIESGADEA